MEGCYRISIESRSLIEMIHTMKSRSSNPDTDEGLIQLLLHHMYSHGIPFLLF